MRQFLLVFLLLLTACTTLPPLPAGTPEASSTPSPSFHVIFHPDGPLYVSDKVSLEVLTPTGFDPKGKSVRVKLGEKELGVQEIHPYGLGNRDQATFYWAWDTKGLEAGSYPLTFTVTPGDATWNETVTLLPASVIPSPEPKAHWESVTSDCCTIYYITDTAAALDIESLADMADAQAVLVEQRFGADFKQKIPLTFIPRTIGHSGFASDGIYISYLDENYVGSATAQVTHHEMVHWLDNQEGGDLRPSILVEGLAVYLSGGHFKEEAILPRAAALLDLGWYIPLRQLTDSFYTSQHEIGYLEAAAVIAYLVQTYGWEKFNTFYRDIHAVPSNTQSAALEAALQAHFGVSFDTFEANFLDFLRAQTVSDADRTDLRLSVAFYDTVRHYQQVLDPSAYFLTAWLPDINSMREHGIVADLLRHPHDPINQRIETLLVAADADLRAGSYLQTEANLRAARALIDLQVKIKE